MAVRLLPLRLRGKFFFLKVLLCIIPPGVSVISRYKLVRKLASSDITSGRVHLDVCWKDQSTSLPSGL